MLQKLIITALCLLPSLAQAQQQWRLGLITPPPHRWTQTAQAFADQLQASPDSNIQLSIFPSGQLGNEAQMLQLLQTGAIDFGFFTTSELANRLPSFSAFYTPYLAKNPRHAADILRSEAALDILQDTQSLGLVGLGFGMAGMRQILLKDNATTLADLRGLKVRVVPDRPLTDFWLYANTSPTPIPLSALYDAFANGQIDAMHIDFENTLRLKLYKHADSLIHSDHMMFPMVAVVSAKTWAKMSHQQQQDVQQTLRPLLSALLDDYSQAEQDFLQQLKQLSHSEGFSVSSAGQDFFTEPSQRWNIKWNSLSPNTAKLIEQAKQLEPAMPSPNSPSALPVK